MNQLTPKQESFAHAVALGMSQSDAYRAAYAVREGTKADSINQKASKIMAEVKGRRVTRSGRGSRTDHPGKLSGAPTRPQRRSRGRYQYSAAIAAEVARGKAIGLYVERTELTGANGGPVSMNWQIEFVKSGKII